MTLRKVPDVTLTASQQTVDVSKVEADPCAFKLQNESIYTLDIGIGPDTHSLAAWMADVFPTPGISQFQVTPRSLIGAVNPPSSILLVTTAGAGDVIPGTYPCPLVRQVSAYQTQVSLGTVSSAQGTVGITLPPGTHTVMVLSNDPAGTVGVIGVRGHTTGFNYKIWGSGGSEGYAFGDLFPVDSADDAVIDVTVTVFSGPGVASARLVALLDPAGVFVNNPLGLPAYTALVLSNSPPATARNGFTTHLNSLSVVLATDQTAVPADVSDRSARLLGAVSAAAASTWDVSDRAARLLGTLTQANWQAPDQPPISAGIAPTVAPGVQLVAGVGGKQIRVHELIVTFRSDVVVPAQGSITLTDGSGGAQVWGAFLPGGAPPPQIWQPRGAKVGTVGNGLFLLTSAAFGGNMVAQLAYSQS